MLPEELLLEKNAWRVDPAIAGGGLFHDLAPHQLDLMFHFFGAAEKISGIAANQSAQYPADDMVAGNILFENGVAFSGAWCFNAAINSDRCEIIGSEGTISLSFFNGNTITLTAGDDTTRFDFTPLQHVQEPMISEVVKYFLDEAVNPCTGAAGAEIMRWMETFTAK
jgi:predicted dehydrogenase